MSDCAACSVLLRVEFVEEPSLRQLCNIADLVLLLPYVQIASQARLMSAGLRKLAANAHKTNTTVMFVNQLRHKVCGRKAPGGLCCHGTGLLSVQ